MNVDKKVHTLTTLGSVDMYRKHITKRMNISWLLIILVAYNIANLGE